MNNGVIKDMDADDKLILQTAGNITNNNHWINYKTVFTGTTEQHITLASGKIFIPGLKMLTQQLILGH